MGYYRTIYQYPFTKDQPWKCCKMPDNCPGVIENFVYNPVAKDSLAVIDNSNWGTSEDEMKYTLLFQHVDDSSAKSVLLFANDLELPLPMDNPYSPILPITLAGSPYSEIYVDGHGNYIFQNSSHFVIYNPYDVVGYKEAVDKNPKKPCRKLKVQSGN